MSIFYSIVKYIYFLTVPELLFWLCTATFIYVIFSLAVRKRFIVYVVSGLLLGIWLAFVLYFTVFSRKVGEECRYSIIPFHSYWEVIQGAHPRRLRSNMMNAVMFFPAGVFSASLFSDKCKKKKWIILILTLTMILSIVIEFIQYYFSLGYAETDDIIHNTLGVILGLLLFFGFKKLFVEDL